MKTLKHFQNVNVSANPSYAKLSCNIANNLGSATTNLAGYKFALIFIRTQGDYSYSISGAESYGWLRPMAWSYGCEYGGVAWAKSEGIITISGSYIRDLVVIGVK